VHIEFTSNMVVWFHAKFADVTTPRVLMLLMGAGDRSWSRSCSVRHRSNSRPMLAIGDSAASTAASAAAALGRKKSRSSSDAGSSRRSRSGSSGQDAKKLSASADDDDDDSGYGNYRQLNTFLQGPRILFVHLSYTCYAAYTHVTSRPMSRPLFCISDHPKIRHQIQENSSRVFSLQETVHVVESSKL